MNTYKGFFKPKNPEKYKGDHSKIIYRSRWELVFMDYLDRHPDVIYWQSEEFFIPYKSPLDNRIHRYFPDFLVKKKELDDTITTTVVEIKPKAQTKPPKKPKRITKQYIKEVYEWGKNEAKWKYAQEYCIDRNWKFIIMTEKELGIKW